MADETTDIDQEPSHSPAVRESPGQPPGEPASSERQPRPQSGPDEALLAYGDRIHQSSKTLGEDSGRDGLRSAMQHIVEAVEHHARTVNTLGARQRAQDGRIEARAKQLVSLVKNQRD